MSFLLTFPQTGTWSKLDLEEANNEDSHDLSASTRAKTCFEEGTFKEHISRVLKLARLNHFMFSCILMSDMVLF